VLERGPLQLSEELVVGAAQAHAVKVPLLVVVEDRLVRRAAPGREAGGKGGDPLDADTVLGGWLLDAVDASLPVLPTGRSRYSSRNASSASNVSPAITGPSRSGW
jgi:hypothetical protein